MQLIEVHADARNALRKGYIINIEEILPMAADEKTKMEDALATIDAVLNTLNVPEPPSLRQLIIARQSEIRQKLLQGHRLPAIRDALAHAGIDIKITTLRDYLYNGTPSKEGRAARVVRSKKIAKHREESAEQSMDAGLSFRLPSDATEATAGGAPVRARKMI